LALVVDRRAFVSHSVQPVVARNYLFCGICFFGRFTEAKFKVARERCKQKLEQSNTVFTN